MTRSCHNSMVSHRVSKHFAWRGSKARAVGMEKGGMRSSDPPSPLCGHPRGTSHCMSTEDAREELVPSSLSASIKPKMKGASFDWELSACCWLQEGHRLEGLELSLGGTQRGASMLRKIGAQRPDMDQK